MDLCSLKCIREGSQFDPYLHVETYPFTGAHVRTNWDMLPRYHGPTLAWTDKLLAAGKLAHDNPKADGGVRQYYVPR